MPRSLLLLCIAIFLFGFCQTAPVLTERGYSGKATWFNTGLGACGEWNKDSDHIVAVNAGQYSGKLCGKQVYVKNTATGSSVKCTIVDECPGCSWGDLDMSISAFKQLGSLDTGVLPISWSFV